MRATWAHPDETKSAERVTFEHWLRTGRRIGPIPNQGGEVKFNPYHDPRNGQFTFAPGGPRSIADPVVSDRRGLGKHAPQAARSHAERPAKSPVPPAPARGNPKPAVRNASARSDIRPAPGEHRPGAALAMRSGLAVQEADRELGRKYGLRGLLEGLGDGLSDKVESLAKDLEGLPGQAMTAGVKAVAHVTTTAAINSPFTTGLAARLLTQWRDGTSPYNRPDQAEVFAWDSAGSRELFVGYSGDYYRRLTRLGLEQMATTGNGVIESGRRDRLNRMPDFTEWDGLHGSRDSIQVGDTIGTFTHGVTMRSEGGYLYFTGQNAMSLGSFAAENRLRHGRIDNPGSGRFSTTYQTFEWRTPIPPSMRPGR